MKKLLYSALFILLPGPAFNQLAAEKEILPKNERNAEKGRNTLAWILTGGGSAMLVTGISIHGSKKSYSPNEEIGTALIIAGSAAVLTGIVLFSTSAICRSGNNSIGIYLKVENANTLEQAGHQVLINSRSYPALSLIFGLQKE